ncbi:unnamed protein product, partial [Symbiodinium microadriaticum]
EAEARLTQAARLRPKDVAIRQDLNRTRRQSEEVCRRAKEWEKEVEAATLLANVRAAMQKYFYFSCFWNLQRLRHDMYLNLDPA